MKAIDKLNMGTTYINTFIYTAVSVFVLAMLCGMTVGDYIRQRRRLRRRAGGPHDGPEDHRHRAGIGYDSPDSFTKAFTRFMVSHLPHCEKAEARSVPLLRFGSK